MKQIMKQLSVGERRELLRGHSFYPDKDEQAKVPMIYEGEDTPSDDKIVWLHYFCGGCDWWVLEADWPWRHNPESDNTPNLAFGYARVSYPDPEIGYIYLPELEQIDTPLVERDLYWNPKPWSEVAKTLR